MSHPSWVCGLKLECGALIAYNCQSHPSWVCGLKPASRPPDNQPYVVTPFVGVWIETTKNFTFSELHGVTPFVGVWIETVADNITNSTL